MPRRTVTYTTGELTRPFCRRKIALFVLKVVGVVLWLMLAGAANFRSQAEAEQAQRQGYRW